MRPTCEIAVVGGGIIGLTIARELVMRGRRVTLLERDRPGRQASWAGAGMLPPAAPGRPPEFSRLLADSHALWPDLSAALREQTGLDNGFRRCGGYEYAVDDPTRDRELAAWRSCGVTATPVATPDGLAPGSWYELPRHWQVRNPRHLKALEVSCRQLGVDIRSHQQVRTVSDGPAATVVTDDGMLTAETVIVAAGAWSPSLLAPFGVGGQMQPMRGQMLLLETDVALTRIVQHGVRYLVPRFDRRVLVGATVEEAGFDASTTLAGLTDLMGHAARLCPALATARIERHWAGLRPHSPDGPLIARVSDRVIAACGHFRDGLCLSPVTAVRVRELLD